MTAGSAVIKAYNKSSKKSTSWKLTVKKVPEVALAISSAKQTSKNQITVTFNKAIDDAVVFAVSKGTTAQTLTKTISADKKSAVLTMGTNLQTAEYTVTATPAGGTALTATVKCEAAVLTTAKFASDKLVMTKTNFSEGTVVVKGYDQFDNEMAINDAHFTVSKGTAGDNAYASKTGILTVSAISTNYFTIGEKVAVNMIFDNNTKVANATLTVSQAAYIASIEFGEITNDNATLKAARLTSSNLVKGGYYVPVIAKDQYGNTLDADTLTKMKDQTIGNATTMYVTPSSAANTIAYAGNFITKNGSAALEIKKGSLNPVMDTEVAINILSVGGVSKVLNVKVLRDEVIDTLAFDVPSLTAEKTATIGITATDQYGGNVDFYETYPTTVEAKKLTWADGTYIQVSGAEFELTKSPTKKAVTFKLTDMAYGTPVVISYVTAGYKSGAKTYTVAKAATLTNIGSITSKFDSSLSNGQTTDFWGHIEFLDSDGDKVVYGDETPIAYPDYAYLNGLSAPNYVEDGDYNAYEYDEPYVFTIERKSGGAEASDIDNTNDRGVVTADATKTGTDTYTITLWKRTASGTTFVYKQIDTKDIDVTVSASKDLKYTVKASGTLYTGANSDHYVTLKLSGTKDGKDVKVEQAFMKSATVKDAGFETYWDEDIEKMCIDTPTDEAIVTKGLDKTTTVDVLIDNGTDSPQHVTCELKYNDAAPVGTTAVWAKDDEDETPIVSDDIDVSLENIDWIDSDGHYTVDSANVYAYRLSNFWDNILGIKDQYGQYMDDASITITNRVGSVNINAKLNSGKVYLYYKDTPTNGSFNLTVAANGVSKTLHVTITDSNVFGTVSAVDAPTRNSNGDLVCGKITSANSNDVTYQWYRGTVKINNATESTYTPTSAGSYKVEVMGIGNYHGVATSPVIVLTNPSIPTISVANNHQLSVNVAANETVSYQWTKNNQVITGANSNTYTPSTEGAYRCIITGTGSYFGDAYSSNIINMTTAPSNFQYSSTTVGSTPNLGTVNYTYAVTSASNGESPFILTLDGSNSSISHAGTPGVTYTITATGIGTVLGTSTTTLAY